MYSTTAKLQSCALQDKGSVLRRRLQTTVFCQCFSPCGKYLAVADKFGYVSVFKSVCVQSVRAKVLSLTEIFQVVFYSVSVKLIQMWVVDERPCPSRSLPAALGPDATEEALKPAFAFRGSWSLGFSQAKSAWWECHVFVIVCSFTFQFTPVVFSRCCQLKPSWLCEYALFVCTVHLSKHEQNLDSDSENNGFCFRSGSGNIQCFNWNDIFTKVGESHPLLPRFLVINWQGNFLERQLTFLIPGVQTSLAARGASDVSTLFFTQEHRTKLSLADQLPSSPEINLHLVWHRSRFDSSETNSISTVEQVLVSKNIWFPFSDDVLVRTEHFQHCVCLAIFRADTASCSAAAETTWFTSGICRRDR